jgi:hypothetical protein
MLTDSTDGIHWRTTIVSDPKCMRARKYTAAGGLVCLRLLATSR